MRKALLVAITAGGMAVGGAAFATAGELPGAAADAAAGADCQVQAPPRMMSAAQAADAVLQDAGGGRVRSVKLAEEKGAAVYTVSLVAGSRLQSVKVDAFTGEVSAGAAGAGDTGGAADPGAVGDQGAQSGAQRQEDDDEGEDGDDEGEDGGGPVRSGVSGSK